jgi:hypothetical protein
MLLQELLSWRAPWDAELEKERHFVQFKFRRRIREQNLRKSVVSDIYSSAVLFDLYHQVRNFPHRSLKIWLRV